MNILVLSPHRDDAAFSLSLSISHWLAVGHRVTLFNIFTRSLYAPYSDAESVHENDRLSYVSALRKKEDERFVQQLDPKGSGLKMVDLNIKDAPIRLHCDSSIVCDMEVDPNDTCIPKIRKALTKLAEEPHAPTALVLPLGLGHHVDHRTARDASLPLSTEMPCAFYEELPYAARDGVSVDLSRFREDANTRFHEALYPVLCHGSHTRPSETKRRLAQIYVSQIDEQWLDVITNFSHRYHGGERLWANDAWLKVAGENKLSTRQKDLEAEPLPA